MNTAFQIDGFQFGAFQVIITSACAFQHSAFQPLAFQCDLVTDVPALHSGRYHPLQDQLDREELENKQNNEILVLLTLTLLESEVWAI